MASGIHATYVKLHYKGFNELRKLPAVVDFLMGRGNTIAGRAGDGHEVESFTGRARARVTIRTETAEAMRSEATNRTLTTAIG